MLRALLDEGLPFRTARWLRADGIDAVHTRELGLESSPDVQILEAARAEERVCVTLDHDFHKILAATGATTPSVLLIRMQQIDYIETGQLIAQVLREIENKLDKGLAVTATPRGLRFRTLPLH